MDAQGDITQQLVAIGADGDPTEWDRLVPFVYAELRAMAHRKLRREADGHSLTTTALVHEAYLRLANWEDAPSLDRAHFLALAARVMRRVLIDHARQHHAAKREGAYERVPLVSVTEGFESGLQDSAEPLRCKPYHDPLASADERAETLIALDDALTRLAALDARLARVVEYRFFGGLTEEETAEALGITARTVRRDWVKAKGWLLEVLEEHSS
jgi:RNA polymerase sigma factor (sigma-70 family)